MGLLNLTRSRSEQRCNFKLVSHGTGSLRIFFRLATLLLQKCRAESENRWHLYFANGENKTSLEIKINVLRTDVMMKEDKFLKKLWCCVGGVI